MDPSCAKIAIRRHLQVREHAQQAPQQAAVYGLSISLPLNEQQDPVDGFTLDLQITDDVEPEQLQPHVPAEPTEAAQHDVTQAHVWATGTATTEDLPDWWQHWIL